MDFCVISGFVPWSSVWSLVAVQTMGSNTDLCCSMGHGHQCGPKHPKQ